METLLRVSAKSLRINLFRLFLLAIFTFSNIQSYAQDPDVNHLKKNFSAIKDEQKKIAEEKEMWSYVYMILGFGIVIAIAWFTTVSARKRAKIEAEKKQKLIMKLHGDPHHHKRGHLHKARR